MLSQFPLNHHLLYFAYGSNLHPYRLKLRVPSSQAIGPAALPGHQLRFHKCGRDGSGKCNVWRTNNPADRVIGVVYRIQGLEKALLDAAEGVGRGYQVEEFQVSVLDAERNSDGLEYSPAQPSFCYVAESAHIDDSLRPFGWYHDLVVSGARHHGLPADYIEQLCAVTTQADYDSERHALHQRILRNL